MTEYDMLIEFCNSGVSLQEARDLLLTCGYDSDRVQEAVTELVMGDTTFRWVPAPYPVNAKIFLT